MTDALIEAVARAILASDPTCDYDICRDKYAHLPVGDYQRNWWDALHKQARNAIAAIDASGTHVVTPVKADGQMVGEWLQAHANGHSIETCFYRMIAARPKVTQ